MHEQTEKAFDTDFMKQLAQNSRAMAEAMEKSGLRSQFEQLHKQIVAVAPVVVVIKKLSVSIPEIDVCVLLISVKGIPPNIYSCTKLLSSCAAAVVLPWARPPEAGIDIEVLVGFEL